MSFDPASGTANADAVRNLRPLSIGEILDRAFSITFRNIIAFFSLVALVIVPQMLLYYLGMRGFFDQWTKIITQTTSASGNMPPPDPAQLLQAYASGAPFLVALFIVAITLVPLSNAAVVSGVSRAYLGMAVRFRDCYGDALGRWPALIGLMLLWLAFLMLATLTVMFAFVGISMALGALSLAGLPGVIAAITLGIILGIGALLFGCLLYLAAAYSFVGAVLERVGVGHAFSSGFARVFVEGTLWRSLGIAASLFGIVFGFEIIGAVVGGISVALVHSFALEFAVSALIGATMYPFIFAVVAVSYYDVRIRREGFDLQMLAERLAAPAATPSSSP